MKNTDYNKNNAKQLINYSSPVQKPFTDEDCEIPSPYNGMLYSYDFTVTKINRVLLHESNSEWQCDNTWKENLNTGHVLTFCISGSASFNLIDENISFDVKPGDICYFPPYSKRTGHSNPDDPWKYISILFGMDFIKGDPEKYFDSLRGLISPAPPNAPALFENILKCWIGRSPGSIISCRSMILELLAALIQQKEYSYCSSTHYRIIAQVRSYLYKHMSEHITIDEIADHLGVSRSYLRSTFSKVMKMTVKQYLNLIRVSYARDLLSDGETDVSGAAMRTGFNDVFYFSRVFHKIMGCPPSQYRK